MENLDNENNFNFIEIENKNEIKTYQDSNNLNLITPLLIQKIGLDTIMLHKKEKNFEKENKSKKEKETKPQGSKRIN